MSAITKISGLAGRGWRKRGSIGDATGRERTPHRGSEVQGTLTAVPALPGEAHGQLAGQQDGGTRCSIGQLFRGWRA